MTVKNIILDPGHGGLDADGNYTTAPAKMFTFPDGTVAYEGVLNRAIMYEVQRCLESHTEFNVYTTVDHDDPTDVSLEARKNFVNSFNKNETIMVSIHCNAGGGTGFELYTTVGPTKSDELAEAIADAVEHVYENHNLKLRYDFSDGDKDKEVDFYVLRKTKCPAVLLECFFFDNRKDFDLGSTPEFQGDLGSFIYTGILNFISNETNN